MSRHDANVLSAVTASLTFGNVANVVRHNSMRSASTGTITRPATASAAQERVLEPLPAPVRALQLGNHGERHGLAQRGIQQGSIRPSSAAADAPQQSLPVCQEPVIGVDHDQQLGVHFLRDNVSATPELRKSGQRVVGAKRLPGRSAAGRGRRRYPPVEVHLRHGHHTLDAFDPAYQQTRTQQNLRFRSDKRRSPSSSQDAASKAREERLEKTRSPSTSVDVSQQQSSHQGKKRRSPSSRSGRKRSASSRSGKEALSDSASAQAFHPADPRSRKRSASSRSAKEAHADSKLKEFRPTFRADWLCVLREELLDSTLDFNAEMRADLEAARDSMRWHFESEFSEAVAEMRHDFADAFDYREKRIQEGNPGACFRRRVCNIDFTPVLESIEKVKSEIDFTQMIEMLQQENTRLKSDIAEIQKNESETVREGLGEMRAEILDECRTFRNQLIDDVAKVQEDVAKVQEDVAKVQSLVGDVSEAVKEPPEVDFGPLFEAIAALDRGSAEVATQTELSLNEIHEAIRITSKELLREMHAAQVVDLTPLLDSVSEVRSDVFELVFEQSWSVESILSLANSSAEQIRTLNSVAEKSHELVEQIDLDQFRKSLLKDTQELMVQTVPKPPSFEPVINAIAKSEQNVLGTTLKSIDARHKELQNQLKATSSEAEKQFEKRTVGTDKSLAGLLDAVVRNAESQGASLGGISAGVSELAARPQLSLDPVLHAIGKINVKPQVNLKEITDSIAAVTQHFGPLQTSVVELDAKIKASADSNNAAVQQVGKQVEEYALELKKKATADVEARVAAEQDLIASLSAAIATAAERQETTTSERLQAVFEAIESIEVEPQVHLDPVTLAISKLREQHSQAHRGAMDTTKAVETALAKRVLDVAQELRVVLAAEVAESMSNVVSFVDQGFFNSKEDAQEILGNLGRSQASFERDLQGLTKEVAAIDINPQCDVDAILHEIREKFDVKACVRPMLDVVSTAMARMEHMTLKADLDPVLDAIRKVDVRFLEAISRTDEKHYADLSHNFRSAALNAEGRGRWLAADRGVVDGTILCDVPANKNLTFLPPSPRNLED